jgi:hypothetical protein
MNIWHILFLLHLIYSFKKITNHVHAMCDITELVKTAKEVRLNTGSSHGIFIIPAGSRKMIIKMSPFMIANPLLYDPTIKYKWRDTELTPTNSADAEMKILSAIGGLSTSIIQQFDSVKCDVFALRKVVAAMGDDVTNKAPMLEFLDFVISQVKLEFARPEIAISSLEHCDYTLSRFLDLPPGEIFADILRSIIFEIAACIKSVRATYPGFEHGDLHTDNVLIVMTGKVAPGQVDEYVIDGVNYYKPRYGIKIKIADFGMSIVPELGIVSDQVLDRVMISQNRHDLALLFRDIHYSGSSTSAGVVAALEPTLNYLKLNEQSVDIDKILPNFNYCKLGEGVVVVERVVI